MKKLLLLFLIPLLACTKETEVFTEVEQKTIEEMALPSTNLSISEIASTLGHPVSYDVGTLCTHPNINKWSKWKPVRYPKSTGITAQELTSVRCGMDIPKVDGATNIANYYRINPGFKWGYLRPTGGANSPYRIGDFRWYEPAAQKFYTVNSPTTITYNTAWSELLTTIQPGGMDFEALGFSDWHYGIIVAKSGLAPYAIGIDPLPLRDKGSGEVRGLMIPNPEPGAYYEVYSFLVEGSEVTQLNNAYLLEDGMRYFTYTAAYTVYIYASLLPGNRAEWEIRITNNTQEEIFLTNTTVWLRYADMELQYSLDLGEKKIEIGNDLNNLFIPAGGQFTDSGEVQGALNEYGTRGGYIAFSVGTPATLIEKEVIR